MNPIRLAVLLSGGGSTLQNLIDRIADARLSARIVQVISDRTDAFGLKRAGQAQLSAAVIARKDCDNRDEFGRRIFDIIQFRHADLVCMAGFLQLLPIPNEFRHRVMNIHPALLPAFANAGLLETVQTLKPIPVGSMLFPLPTALKCARQSVVLISAPDSLHKNERWALLMMNAVAALNFFAPVPGSEVAQSRLPVF